MAKEEKIPWQSGFCGNGHCEGTRPKSHSGKPIKTCPRVFSFGAVCEHSCHTMLDKMFELSDMERVIQENPEYSPPKLDFWMPSLEERALSFSRKDAPPPIVIQSHAPDVVPPTVRHTFIPTATGRSARGELEATVKDVCDEWLVEQEGNSCTPSYISIEAGRKMGIRPPSQGAINAVLERWVTLGFAEVARKPTRFIKYTDDGIKLGLEVLKMRAKQRRVSHQAAVNRGEKRDNR